MKTSAKILVFFSFMVVQMANAQIDFSQIPDTQEYQNKGQKVLIKNNKLTQFYKEYNCLWEVSYAKISGLKDSTAQNFLNDWLIGMTAFGTCEGDKEVCYDFVSHHYFYKQTFVSFLQNDLLSFYTKEGNCRTKKDTCTQIMDFVIYDLKTRQIVRNENLLINEKALGDLLEKKVAAKGQKLVADWRSFDKQIGIEYNAKEKVTKIVIYLYNDVVGNNVGITIDFSKSEIAPFIRPQLFKRIFG